MNKPDTLASVVMRITPAKLEKLTPGRIAEIEAEIDAAQERLTIAAKAAHPDNPTRRRERTLSMALALRDTLAANTGVVA